MAGVLSGFSFATAVEIENYEPTQLNTLLERSNAEIKNKHS